MNRLHFLGLRLVRTLATLVIIVFITFAIFSLWPSDPATLACGRPCTPENLERARAFMGYDLPWYTQFWHYLQGIVGGRTFGEGSGAIACASPCLGYSFRLSTPVSELVATRLPVTASIAVGAAVLWLAIGVGAGVVSALRRGSRLDRTIMTGTVLGISSPAYLVGLLGILLFGFTLDMVPVSGYVPFADSPVDWAWHLILPWCVLALISAAVYARMVRGEMLENLGEDYVRTARAVGLPERRVVGRHVMRNISLPVVTYFALDLGGLLGGAVITERVFSMQGLGALLMDAVGTSDVPVVMGVTLVAAAFVVVANHFKSKGSVPEGAPPGNVDSGDGQGNANAIRVAQAGALASFAARFSGKPTLLVGDFNSYSQEDPIKALEAAGWARVSGAGEASYVYAGRSGSLDHVFANAAAKPLLAGVTSWAVNAQESIAFEYSRAGMNAHLAIEADNPYRSSDHNPEVIGLTLLGGDAPAPTPSIDPSAAPSAAPSPAVPSASPAPAPSRAATASSRKAPARAATVSGLARTGADADRAIGIGILLAALGGGLILLSRRLRQRG